MDFATAIGGSVSRQIDGVTHTFPCLTMADWTKVQSRLAQNHRESLGLWVKIMREQGGIGAEVLAALVRDLEKPPTFSECRRWVLTPEGALYAMKIAVEGSEPAIDLSGLCEKLTPMEVMTLAIDVAQIPRGRDGDKGDDHARPLATTSEGPTG